MDSNWDFLDYVNIASDWEIIYNPYNFAGNLLNMSVSSTKDIIKKLSIKNIGFNIHNRNIIKDRNTNCSKFFSCQYIIKELHNSFRNNKIILATKIMHDCHYFFH